MHPVLFKQFKFEQYQIQLHQGMHLQVKSHALADPLNLVLLIFGLWVRTILWNSKGVLADNTNLGPKTKFTDNDRGVYS